MGTKTTVYLETFLQLSEFYAAILALFQGGLHKR